ATYLLAKNPDVTRIYGIDDSEEAILFAKNEYESDRIRFLCQNIADAEIETANTLVSIETIEHLEDPIVLHRVAQRHQVETIIISFPSKKTTHYNEQHLWDINSQDIKDLFSDFIVYKELSFAYDTCLLCLTRHRRTVSPEIRWRPHARQQL